MDVTAINEVKAGKLFCFSEGEYSDYGYIGHFLALVDLSPALFQSVVDEIKADIAGEGVLEEYGTKVTSESDDYDKQDAIKNLFLPRLIRRGVILSIDFTEIHIGSYGRLEIDGVTV